jgi:hypothetical protein
MAKTVATNPEKVQALTGIMHNHFEIVKEKVGIKESQEYQDNEKSKAAFKVLRPRTDMDLQTFIEKKDLSRKMKPQTGSLAFRVHKK